MAPKPDKKPKTQKPKEVPLGMRGMTPEEMYARSCVTIEALERHLVERTEEMHSARREEAELREKVDTLNYDFQMTQKQRFDIISDFTRQHKSMQDELIQRISVLENTISELRDQLELSKVALEETRKDKDQVIEQKNKEIAEQESKMTQMAQEFADMLKETLDKMSERIDHNVQATAPQPAPGNPEEDGSSPPGDSADTPAAPQSDGAAETPEHLQGELPSPPVANSVFPEPSVGDPDEALSSPTTAPAPPPAKTPE
eukprot:NODE_2904_length_1017_cov_18.764463_g2429_i0.p1 GENE.NODE_2904_length_1017_cov_18.764463_g2429_i0~~NODE_2904_length_1017_cov_18.764463_g2429_i0.p1  ORF type:complete len:258 (+),score=49.69 NODE_2904_length_1017_cov_18.764463_g2429_i0:170-943(+)